MSEAVKNMFASIAGRYDLLNRVLSVRLDLAWRKQAVAMLDGRCERVLDVACGTFDLSCIALQNDKAHA
ncbi:MAG: class I SAM-dependent methyltransferase, partial [Planctomycetota bacterium]